MELLLVVLSLRDLSVLALGEFKLLLLSQVHPPLGFTPYHSECHLNYVVPRSHSLVLVLSEFFDVESVLAQGSLHILKQLSLLPQAVSLSIGVSRRLLRYLIESKLRAFGRYQRPVFIF